MWVRLQEDIDTIFKRDPAARNKVEVLLCYPGLHALFFHRMAHRCWLGGFTTLARFISHVSRMLTGIEIHPGASVGRRVFIDHGMGVVIGETAEIHDDCTIYQGVTLGGTSLEEGKRHPTLEKGVVVGAGAKVLGPFTVGEFAKIGSNAVVTKAVPANATAVGNPARMIVKDAATTQPDHAIAKGDKNSEFVAYGVSKSADDPLLRAIHGLINQAEAQQRKIDSLEKAINMKDCEGNDAKGNQKRSDQMPSFDELNKLVDD